MSTKVYATGSEFPPIAPETVRLYSMRFGPFPERTRLVLEHKNIQYETVNVHLRQKPSWLWDMNPNGKVPVLEHDGKVLYESLVTCDYLDEIYPENKLTPSDPFQKAKDKLFLVAVFQKVEKVYFKFFKHGYNDEDVNNFPATLDGVEKELDKRGTPFFGGATVQMVDFMMWPHAERLEAIAEVIPEVTLSTERYPKFMQWFKVMGEVPAVKKCRMDTATHVHFIKSAQAGHPDYTFLL